MAQNDLATFFERRDFTFVFDDSDLNMVERLNYHAFLTKMESRGNFNDYF